MPLRSEKVLAVEFEISAALDQAAIASLVGSGFAPTSATRVFLISVTASNFESIWNTAAAARLNVEVTLPY